MLVHLYGVGPVLKQHVHMYNNLATCNSSIPRLHPRSQHTDRGSTMLTRLHTEGWCLVDFFKPADWIYRVHEKGGARLLGAVRLLGKIRYNLLVLRNKFNQSNLF